MFTVHPPTPLTLVEFHMHSQVTIISVGNSHYLQPPRCQNFMHRLRAWLSSHICQVASLSRIHDFKIHKLGYNYIGAFEANWCDSFLFILWDALLNEPFMDQPSSGKDNVIIWIPGLNHDRLDGPSLRDEITTLWNAFLNLKVHVISTKCFFCQSVVKIYQIPGIINAISNCN